MSLSQGPESGSDHAAKWETSDLLYFYPHLVDLAALGTAPLTDKQQPPHGIGGLDPRTHAAVTGGRRNVELTAESIGRKAQELLASLPAGEQAFGLPALNLNYWWGV